MSTSPAPGGAAAPDGCPVLQGFDPLGPDQLKDPYTVLAKARREVPVFYSAEHDRWFVTRFEDVEEVLRDTDTYSSAKFVELPDLPEEVTAALPNGHPLQATLITLDPPAHTRVRKLAQKAFTLRQANMHIDEVRGLCNSLLDEFIDTGRIDLAKAYCTQIPIRVIGPVLGVSMENAEQLRRWGIETQMMIVNAPHMSRKELIEGGRAPAALDRFVRGLIEDRRANPRDEKDLVTSLIFAEGDHGERMLDDNEIVGVVTVAINGSADTAATTMGHCIQWLLSEPSRWEEVLADRRLIDNAVEETLRLSGPARTLRRDTTRECVLGGVTIPEGATLAVHVGSGSRDEAVFDSSEQFDLHRENVKRHLGFGRWTHFCIGAPLARMQLRVAIETLLERTPSLRLVPGYALEYPPSYSIKQLIGGLEVEWDT